MYVDLCNSCSVALYINCFIPVIVSVLFVFCFVVIEHLVWRTNIELCISCILCDILLMSVLCWWGACFNVADLCNNFIVYVVNYVLIVFCLRWFMHGLKLICAWVNIDLCMNECLFMHGLKCMLDLKLIYAWINSYAEYKCAKGRLKPHVD